MEEQSYELSTPFLDQEMVAEDKIPSIDGFFAKFFTYNLDLVRKHFLAIVHHFSHNQKLPKMFEHTLITLISKPKYATCLVNFWPLYLCKTFYKVIAKVLANKLKKVLWHGIHQVQSAFIKGRYIANNIVLVLEIGG